MVVEPLLQAPDTDTGRVEDALAAKLFAPDFINHLRTQVGEVWPPRKDQGKGQYLIVREVVDNMLLQEFGIQR